MAKLKFESKFGVAPHNLIFSESISLAEKGLYLFIQAKPEGWDFSAERIEKETDDTLYTVKKTLKKLEKSGYLERVRHKNEKGHWEIEYILNTIPKVEIQPLDKTPTTLRNELPTDLPKVEIRPLDTLPKVEYPPAVFRPINKERYINNIIKKDNNKLLSKKENSGNQEKLDLNNSETFKKKVAPKKKFSIPTIEDIKSYCEERGNNVDWHRFHDHYTSNGWKVGKNPMKDWKAAVRTWERSNYNSTNNQKQNKNGKTEKPKPLIGRMSAETVKRNLDGWEELNPFRNRE